VKICRQFLDAPSWWLRTGTTLCFSAIFTFTSHKEISPDYSALLDPQISFSRAALRFSPPQDVPLGSGSSENRASPSVSVFHSSSTSVYSHRFLFLCVIFPNLLFPSWSWYPPWTPSFHSYLHVESLLLNSPFILKKCPYFFCC